MSMIFQFVMVVLFFFFNEKTLYRIMFRSIKQVFLALLSFSTSKASMINGSNSQHVYL